MRKEYEQLAMPKETLDSAIRRLYDIVSILRKECPWDREQTHQTLVTPMLEEVYEAIDAIEREDYENLREELGDMLLHVVFNSILGDEAGNFTMVDVINEECEKMIRRHPHVFSDEISTNRAKTVDKVLEKWENIKSKEHANASVSETLENVPRAFPALTRSTKVQKKAAKSGFDWAETMEAFNKISEESEELKEAIALGNHNNIEEELGDLLFAVVNVSRFVKVDAEMALRKSTDKFIERFKVMESIANESGRDMESMTVDEMEELWQVAKEKLKH